MHDQIDVVGGVDDPANAAEGETCHRQRLSGKRWILPR
jgi:hypothetical protein